MRGFPVLAGALVACALFAALPAAAVDDGLARTPPMGWNSWNRFQCDVGEQLVRETADALVASGLRAAGYQYVIIDDCWQSGRDASGDILPDPVRFPSGMRALADYVHARGLKLGLYSDAGDRTCQGRPGSWGHEQQDARRYAAWGVDYVKYDWCASAGLDARDAYARMHAALRATGRPMVFSLCEWGTSRPWMWAADVGHLWRTGGDITDAWSAAGTPPGPPPSGQPPPGPPPAGMPAMALGVVQILDIEAGLADYAGPGHWNDPDMLEVGNDGMSIVEYRAHFSMWAMLAAPLIAGNDLRTMPDAIRAILANAEVIALDQDPLGRQARRVRRDGDIDVWVKPLADGSQAVALLNRGAGAVDAALRWADLGLPPDAARELRDLWRHANLGRHRGGFRARVESHAALVLRVSAHRAH